MRSNRRFGFENPLDDLERKLTGGFSTEQNMVVVRRDDDETKIEVHPSKSGALKGAAAGAAAGSVIPVLGTTAGALAGALLGFILGPKD